MPHFGVLNAKSVLWNFIKVKNHFWLLNAGVLNAKLWPLTFMKWTPGLYLLSCSRSMSLFSNNQRLIWATVVASIKYVPFKSALTSLSNQVLLPSYHLSIKYGNLFTKYGYQVTLSFLFIYMVLIIILHCRENRTGYIYRQSSVKNL